MPICMVFADAEDIEPDPISVLDLFHQFAHAVRRRHRAAGFGISRRETIDANLHEPLLKDVLTSNYMMLR